MDISYLLSFMSLAVLLGVLGLWTWMFEDSIMCWPITPRSYRRYIVVYDSCQYLLGIGVLLLLVKVVLAFGLGIALAEQLYLTSGVLWFVAIVMLGSAYAARELSVFYCRRRPSI